MYKYLIYFLAFSFLGWLLEVIYSAVKTGHFINRGLCYGPFCPIYGVGICLSYLLLSGVDSFILLALFSMAIATLVEFLVGLFADRVLGERLWDYSFEGGNILGYVCPRFSVIWGIAIATAIRIIPLFDYLILSLNTPVWYAVFLSLFVGVMVDVKLSLLKRGGGIKIKYDN